VSAPETHRRRRASKDVPGRRSNRSRPLILVAGLAVVVLAAAGIAYVLGGGLASTGPATAQTTARVTASRSAAVSPIPSPAVGAAASGSQVVPSSLPPAAPRSTATAGSPPPTIDGEPGIRANRITIDRLGIDLAIIEGDGIDAPIGKVAHFPSTGWPGGGTNIYIYGHARAGMFIRLWDARVGDTVQLGLVDGTTRDYVVTKVLPAVPWDAVQYLEPTPTEQLTLQTCTSYSATAPRFVVIAVPAP
jgi:LPXTG-site transpeptidase (sortase) family protein